MELRSFSSISQIFSNLPTNKFSDTINIRTLTTNGMMTNGDTLQTQDSPLYIGCFLIRSNRFTHGYIDDIRIYKRAIDATDVLNLYNLPY